MTEGGVDYSFECAGNLDILREAFLSTHEVFTKYLRLYINIFLIYIYINNNKIAGLGVHSDIGNSSNPKNATNPSNGAVQRADNSRLCFWWLQRQNTTASFRQTMHEWGRSLAQTP